MIIVTLVFKKDLPEILAKLSDHHDFLDKYKKMGLVIASGPTEDKKEGIIIVKSNSIDEVITIIEQDPFYLNNIADYQYKIFFESK